MDHLLSVQIISMIFIWIIRSLSVWWQTAAADMENAIQEMESQDVRAYILDLRNNPVNFLTLYFQMEKHTKFIFLPWVLVP